MDNNFIREKYDIFINNIINTRGQWNIPDGEYYESHHIIPVCMGGEPSSNVHNIKHENLIWLYPEEHYIAHQILALENPNEPKLLRAWWFLNFNCSNKEEYAEIRKQLSDLTSELNRGENNPFYGKHHSEEQKEKWRKDRAGIKPSEKAFINSRKVNTGRKMSEEQKEKLRQRMLNNNPQKGKPLNENQKNAIKKAKEEGRNIMSPEGRKRLSERMGTEANPMKNKFGKENSFYGHHHSKKQKEKWSKERKGKFFGTEESKQNAIAHNPNIKSVICIETKEVFITAKQAASFAGVDSSNITRCCQGKTKTSGGYHWQYYEEQGE